MGIRGFSTLNGMRKETLSKVVYRDGLIYYFLLFGLSLGNLVIIVCLPVCKLVHNIGTGHVFSINVPCNIAYT